MGKLVELARKAEKFIDEHKTGCITTAVIVTAGVLGYLVGPNTSGRDEGEPEELGATMMNTLKNRYGTSEQDELDGVSLDEYELTDIWKEDEYTNMIVNNFTVKDIGKLGEVMINNIPGFTEDTPLTAMIGACKS